MLTIIIPSIEQYDESKNEFISSKEQMLQLEHNLVSISKWESKWRKPFLTNGEKTADETTDYIKCMTLNTVDEESYKYLTKDNLKSVREYIDNPMTATTFAKDNTKGPNREIITSEIIYYQMTVCKIPSEYQFWHLNRLLTLIRICNIKNSPPKKMNKREVMQRNASINAARKAQMNSGG